MGRAVKEQAKQQLLRLSSQVHTQGFLPLRVDSLSESVLFTLKSSVLRLSSQASLQSSKDLQHASSLMKQLNLLCKENKEQFGRQTEVNIKHFLPGLKKAIVALCKDKALVLVPNLEGVLTAGVGLEGRSTTGAADAEEPMAMTQGTRGREVRTFKAFSNDEGPFIGNIEDEARLFASLMKVRILHILLLHASEKHLPVPHVALALLSVRVVSTRTRASVLLILE